MLRMPFLVMVSGLTLIGGCLLPDFDDLDDVGGEGEGEGEGEDECVGDLAALAPWPIEQTTSLPFADFAIAGDRVFAVDAVGVVVSVAGGAFSSPQTPCDNVNPARLTVKADGRFAVLSGLHPNDPDTGVDTSVDRRCLLEFDPMQASRPVARVIDSPAIAIPPPSIDGGAAFVGDRLVTVSNVVDGPHVCDVALSATSIDVASCAPLSTTSRQTQLFALDGSHALAVGVVAGDVVLHRVQLRSEQPPLIFALHEELPEAPENRLAVGVGAGVVILGPTALGLSSIDISAILAARDELLPFSDVGALLAIEDPVPGAIFTIAIDDNGNAVAGGRDGRVYQRAAFCTEREVRFEPWPEPVLPDILDLIADPADAQRLYARNGGQGVQVLDAFAPSSFVETLDLNAEAIFVGFVDGAGVVMAASSLQLQQLSGEAVGRTTTTTNVAVAVGGGLIALADGAIVNVDGGDLDIRGDVVAFGSQRVAGVSSPKGVIVIGQVADTWHLRSCTLDMGVLSATCITREVPARGQGTALGFPVAAAVLDAVFQGALVVSHDSGIATFDAETLSLITNVPIGNLGDRISRPLMLSATCTVFGMSSFFGNSGSANLLQRLTPTSVEAASTERASGSISAIARGADGSIWGIGKAGVLFELGEDAAVLRSCSFALPIARGVNRPLNDIHSSVVDDDGFLLTTSPGELVRVPTVP